MFDELNNENVQLMLALSRENIQNTEQLRKKLNECDMSAFFLLCREHELDGVVASRIIENDLVVLPDQWLSAYREHKEYLFFLRNKALEICTKMEKQGVRMVVLKNGGIMSDMVEDVAACPMEDIDALVKKSDFKKAHAILLQNGFVFKFRSVYEVEELEKAFRDGSTEYYIKTSSGKDMWLELSWRAVAGRWIRLDLEPDCDALIEASYFAKGTSIGILSPEDNLLQVCIHTAKHSYVRAPGLRLHLDVERIVAHKAIDWQLFLKKVEDAHVKTATYFSLYFAALLFHTPIPSEILDALRPTKQKEKRILALISNAGLLHPKASKFTKLDFLKFQFSLYDSIADVFFVIYPKNGRLHEIYDYQSPFLTPYYIFVRFLDLVGIRKKKRK